MKLLLKAALLNRKHYLLLMITIFSMFFVTIGSQMEMLSLGIIAKTGPDAFALFGSQEKENANELSLPQVQERWEEIAGDLDTPMTRDQANAYLESHGKKNLIQTVTRFLDGHFRISENLTALAFILVFVACFKAAALFCSRYFTQLVAIRVSRDLRQKYFEHIQSLPMSFYQEHNIGGLSSRVVGDAGVVAGAINSMLINYIQTPFGIVSTLLACFYISWKLSLIIFVGFPLILIPMIWVAKKIKLISKQMQRNQEGFASVLIDFLAGILTVKVFAMEEFSLRKYKEQNNRMAKLEERSARYGLASRPILHTVASLFFATVILSGLYLFHMGPSDLLVFCGLLYIFYEPIKKFAEENNQVLRGVAAAERMYEVLNLSPTIQDEPDAIEFQEFESHIEFRNVSFRYKDEWILRGFSFSVKKGETVALVGPTGAGKSTIVQLLPRLYDVQEGEILIDSRPLKRYTQKSLREKIAFIPQKPFLFLDTVRENITFGRSFSQDEVVLAAQRAHAEEFIERLPGTYQSMLAESGKNLSGGQQQRLAIARALVKKAPILVMDEATSSLDALSEGKIRDAIAELHGSITQIIIAHRFSTIDHADKIIYLERGLKVAEGTKQQLLETCPNFRRMWEMMYHSEKLETQSS
jgi:ABC-type multidrug transport system fused ATPase/permease subunit